MLRCIFMNRFHMEQTIDLDPAKRSRKSASIRIVVSNQNSLQDQQWRLLESHRETKRQITDSLNHNMIAFSPYLFYLLLHVLRGMRMSEVAISETDTTLPATAKQIAYARRLAAQQNVVLPWGIQQDRRAMSQWIDTQRSAPRVRDTRPSSKQVAFAERIARIKRSSVPDECFQDRALMSRWIDSNKP